MDTDARLQGIIVAACNASPAGCIVTDARGRIVFVNQRVETIFGYERNELVGQAVDLLVPDELTGSHRRSRERFAARATDRPMGGGRVLHGRRKDGSLVPLEIGLTPIAAEGERFVISSLVDVTSRLESEDRAVQSEQRFAHSQKLEALGSLAGGISHDFNNILLAILGYAELVKTSTSLDPESLDDVEAILEAALRGRDLVQRILSFARHREGKREQIHLHEIVSEAYRLLKGTLPRTVNVRLGTDPATPTVMGDATQIHQVVTNLATNAAAAMPNGGTLEIQVEPARVSRERAAAKPGAREGLYACISVTDTGTGMNNEVKARLFEPFFTTKQEGVGTGLGLSMVQAIVTALGGFIEIDSEVGIGTSIRVLIPALLRSHASERPPPGPARFRALWVDDEPRLAALGRRSLTRLGFEVSMHTSSLQALEEFKGSPDAFDLVVSDNTMPHLSGLAFLAEVSALRPELPTLMVSGRGLELDPANLRRHGVRRVLAKPFAFEELRAVIRELVPASCQDQVGV